MEEENCQRCILMEKRFELYHNFFHNVVKEVYNFDKGNTDKLNSVSNIIRDTLRKHGEITAKYSGPNSLYHHHVK